MLVIVSVNDLFKKHISHFGRIITRNNLILCVLLFFLIFRNLFNNILNTFILLVMLSILGARCSSVVTAFAHGAMGHRIDPSWGGPIELFLLPSSAPRLV